jgi:phage minor structural protein
MVRKLTDSEIFKYGCANLYLFFRTSIDYFRKNMKAPSVPSRPSPKSDFHGLVVKDQDNRELGILDKAYNVSVKRTVNEVWTASFSLPRDDPKNELCSHFNYIDITSPSDRYMGLYRIMPAETRISASEESITYRCEHVLSTLLDDVMEGYHDFPGYNTEYVLQSILNLQEEKRWELGEVEFERFFHYSFENENGLLAPILSVPEAFDVPYEFTFDTTVFPWRLNLVRPDNEVKAEIRWGKDMIDFSEVSDPTNIVNYIIPKGAGEGVNQLTIEAVNDGERFLKDDASIREWGTKKYIWIDERFEDAESLKSNAQSLLNQWKIPKISFDVNTVDLSVLEEDNDHRYFIAHDQTIEGAKTIKALQRPLNGITRIIANDKEYEARILSEDIPDLLEQEYNVNYEINNKVDDLATSQTNIERKQQVNEAYSKGATNIMTFSYQDNCDSNIPAVIPFYIDDDVVNVNTLELTLRTKKFRAYSETTKGGGGTVTSTSSGGSSTQTSSSGGGTSRSTNSGGGSSQTSSAGGDHRHTMFVDTGNTGGGGTLREYRAAEGNRRIAIETSSGGDMMTAGSSGNHSHSVSIPNHSHDFSTPNHTHTVSIPAHRHQVDLPDHTHDVEHKIVELDETPSSLTIKVDGNTVDFNGTSGDRIDMIPYLDKNDNGKISRGRHEVEILPDSLARIEADLILRVFIRSHLGGKF